MCIVFKKQSTKQDNHNQQYLTYVLLRLIIIKTKIHHA